MGVSKKGGLRLLVFASLIVLLGGIFYASANIDATKSWHPLQQVSKSANDLTSVDADSNGVVDNADNADKVGGMTSANIIDAINAASGGGGSAGGMTYTVVIVDEGNPGNNCPTGFSKVDIGDTAGWDNLAYVSMSKDGLFIGGLYGWVHDGSLGSNIRARIPSGWGGFICYKTYEASKTQPPRSIVLTVDDGTNCNNAGLGRSDYNDFDNTGGSSNGWTYVVQAPYGLYIGQLDWWDQYSYGEDEIITSKYHNSHVGHTCWKVQHVTG
jgi:hypothetical protein